MEPIKPEGEASVNLVRNKESKGACKTSQGRRDWSAGGMNYVEHHRQESANLCRWGLTADPKCSLFDKPGTLEHVLSSCTTALTKGIYR